MTAQRRGIGCLSPLLGLIASIGMYVAFANSSLDEAKGCDGGLCGLCLFMPLFEPAQLAVVIGAGVAVALLTFPGAVVLEQRKRRHEA
jgi:hypothetical protein